MLYAKGQREVVAYGFQGLEEVSSFPVSGEEAVLRLQKQCSPVVVLKAVLQSGEAIL